MCFGICLRIFPNFGQRSVASNIFFYAEKSRRILWIYSSFVHVSLPRNSNRSPNRWNDFSGKKYNSGLATLAPRRVQLQQMENLSKHDHLNTVCDTINVFGHKLKNFVAAKHLIERTIIFGVNTSRGFDLYNIHLLRLVRSLSFFMFFLPSFFCYHLYFYTVLFILCSATTCPLASLFSRLPLSFSHSNFIL